MKARRIVLFAGLLVGLFSALVTSAHAATYTWTGDTNNNFTDPGNWGGTWDHWSDYRFGGTPTRTSMTINDYRGIGSITLQSGLTTDIVIDSTPNPVIMGTDQSGSSALISIAADSSNLTINGNYIASTAVTWDVGAGRTLTLNGPLNDWYNPASLVKNGEGTAVLSGSNTYSGTTTISGGTLILQGAAFMAKNRNYTINSGAVLDLDGSSINNLPNGAMTISGSGTLRVTNSAVFGETLGSTPSCNLSLGSGAWIDVQATATMQNGGWTCFTWSGNQAGLNVDGTFNMGDNINNPIVDALTGAGSVIKGWGTNSGTLTVGTANGSGTFSGTISNASGAISLTKAGSGTQALTGANSYTGKTTISAGTLQIGDGGATGSLSTSSAITNNGNFTINRNNAVTQGTDFSGAAITGSGSLTQAGTGTTTLTGANTYSGGTMVRGGTLKVTGQDYLPGNGGITIGTGATLMTDAANDANTQSITSAITINGGTLTAGTGTPANNGHGPWGNYYLNNGASIQAGGNATSTISASLGVNGSGGYTPINVDGGSTLNISGDIFGVSYVSYGGFSKSGGGTLVLSGYNKSASQGMLLSAGTVEFSTNSLPTNLRAYGGPAGYSADIQGNATLRWASGNTQDISFENDRAQIRIGDGVTATFDTNGNNVTLGTAFDLGSSKTGAMTKTGEGTLTLFGNNTYTGGTTVNGGTLQIGSGGRGASIGGTSGVVLSNGANITFNHADGVAFGATVSGSGSFTKAGTGVLTIAASHNYTGPTTVNGGTLRLLGSTHLADNLQSTTLNSNNWTTYTSANGGRGSVTATGSGANLYARGYLNTLNQYDPAQTGGLVITGNWVFTNSGTDYDLMQIVEHSSGVGGGGYGETTNGVEFNFRENNNVPGFGGDGNYAITTNTSSGNLNVKNGDNLWFRCVDDGSGHLSFLVNDLTNSTSGSATGTITAGTATNNYITFHNRELGYTSQLSNVVITSLSGGGSLPTATALTVSASATLDLNGVNQAIGGLSGPAGAIIGNSSANAAKLTLDLNSADTTFGGTIQDGLSSGGTGQVALEVDGGTWTFTGNNTYSGPTTVSGGVLRADAVGTLSPNSDATISGGTLDAGNFIQTVKSLTIGALGTLNLYVGDILTISGTADFGFGSLTLSNTAGLHSGTNVLLTYGGTLLNQFGTPPSLPAGYTLSYATAGELDIVGGPASVNGVWSANSGVGTMLWSDSSNWTPQAAPTARGDSATFGTGTQATIDLGGGTATVSGLTFNNSGTANYTILDSTGTGSLTLQGTGSSSASVTVTTGSDSISANLMLASEVVFSGSGTLALSGSISGSGPLTMSGTNGTLILSGTGLYSGGTIVNAGTLVVKSSTALPDNQSLTVGAGGTLIFDPSFSGSSIIAPPVSAASSAVSPVPEPSTLALLFAGLVVGLGVWRRKGAASCRAVWRTS